MFPNERRPDKGQADHCDQSCDAIHVEIKNIYGEESSESFEVGILFDSRWHRIDLLMEADSLHPAERMEQ